MTPEFLFYAILIYLIVEYLFDQYLLWLDNKTLKRPFISAISTFFNETTFLTMQKYNRTKNNFTFISGLFSFIISITFFSVKGFAWFDEFVQLSITQNKILVPIVYLAILGIAADIISLPFSIYNTFVIEQEFGFNKTTVKTFILDKIKGYFLAIVIGGALLLALISFYNFLGKYFWFAAWILFTIFMLGANLFYTSLILPLFNKLDALPEGSLRTKLEAYCLKVNFELNDLKVMDGSKRSNKGNAFFSGIGKKKTIVLFDTLIEKHTEEEIVAVLAHEVGHYKMKHTLQGMIQAIFQTGIMLWLLQQFIDNEILYRAIGMSYPAFHTGIIAFWMVYSPISTLVGIFTNYQSRKNEYEADEYAAKTYSGKELANALKKLTVDSFSNPFPHPLEVAISFSHPTTIQRIERLEKL